MEKLFRPRLPSTPSHVQNGSVNPILTHTNKKKCMFVIAKHTDKSGMRGHGEKIRKGKDKRMVLVVVDLYIYM